MAVDGVISCHHNHLQFEQYRITFIADGRRNYVTLCTTIEIAAYKMEKIRPGIINYPLLLWIMQFPAFARVVANTFMSVNYGKTPAI